MRSLLNFAAAWQALPHFHTLCLSRTHMGLCTKWIQSKHKVCSNWPLLLLWQCDISEVFSQRCLPWLKGLKHGWYHHRHGLTRGFLQCKGAQSSLQSSLFPYVLFIIIFIKQRYIFSNKQSGSIWVYMVAFQSFGSSVI